MFRFDSRSLLDALTCAEVLKNKIFDYFRKIINVIDVRVSRKWRKYFQ